MTLYSPNPVLRTRQALTDVAVGAWVIGWGVLAWLVHDLVGRLAGPGRDLEDAAGDFARTAGGAGSSVDDVPLLGDRLATPFEAVADAGEAVGRAGATQQDAVGALATWLGLAVFLVPVVWLLARYLPGRFRWAREATAATGLIGADADARLFALRALARRPLGELARVSPNPLAAYEAGDPMVTAALARLELAPYGLEPPTPTSEAPRFAVPPGRL